MSIVNNGWKYWGDFIELKDDSNLTMNFLTGEWFLQKEVMTKVALKIERFRRKEKMKIKCARVRRDTEA